MFKSLRDKLRNWGKALEEEVDRELEAKLERELESAVAGERKAPDVAPPAAPRTAPSPAESPAAPAAPPPPREPAPRDRSAEALSPKRAHEPVAPPVAPTAAPAREEPSRPSPSPPEPKRRADAPKRAAGGRRLAPSARVDEASVVRELEAELARAVDTQRKVGQVVDERAAAGGVLRLSEEKLDELLWDLELGLLEADVALPVIEEIKGLVKERMAEVPLARGGAHELVNEVLRTAIGAVLRAAPFDFDAWVAERAKPVVVMFVGVNGTGKTTSIARIAHRLKRQGRSVVVAAGDTFRAGAIEQLSLHAERLGVKIIKHGPGSDPAAVAFDAIEHARSRKKDVVLLDTAGRQQTNVNLMEEMAKMKRVAKPDLIVFVGDALAGNDAVEQARAFHDTVGLDGVILTKVDADAKGGAALSVAHTIGKPLLFVGVGQEYDDLLPFDPEWMVDRLFGTGGEA